MNEIKDHLSDGGNTELNELENHVKNKTHVLPARVQESMQRDVSNLKYDFDKFLANLDNCMYELEQRLKQWSDYENAMDRLLDWLSEAETTLKNFKLENTLEEKQEQLDKYQVWKF